MNSELISKVWKIAGIVGAATPGALVWKNGQVTFITEEGIVFQVPLSEIKNIKWPFLRMGMGFDAEVNGEKYKFSFAKPNASAAEIRIINGNPMPKVVFESQYFDDISSLMDIKKNKAEASRWKQVLSGKI